MKAIRRSIKGDKDKGHHHHISISQKDAVAIVPPKKVIRALYDYEAKPDRPQELSFSRGDFFHVIGRENDTEMYEACNPSMPNARGLVPVQFFQVLGRTERDSADSTVSSASKQIPDHDSGYSDRSVNSGNAANILDPIPKPMRMSKSMGRGGAMVYGIVLYDFSAERPDELEAKAGEAIIVIAQSTAEWFVAKPIGRLGGPGLIPVSFIEIRDMTTGEAVTDAHAAVQRAGVPTVEDWKKMAQEYKNSSITLGKFESQSQQSLQQGMQRMSLQNGAQGHQNGHTNGQQPLNDPSAARGTMSGGPASGVATQNGWGRTSTASTDMTPAPVSARIPRFCFANDKYWYIIEAAMDDGRHWQLSRFYQDFYDFQIRLLTLFPEEAGNAGKPRTLPFMPGPVTYVTDAISNGRRQNLDEYIRKLLAMPPYISRCKLVRSLFAPREGDFELDPNAPPLDSFENDHRQNQNQGMHGGTNGGYDDQDRDSADYDPDNASRQSSRHDLSSGAGLSAPPSRHHQQQTSHGSTPPPGQYGATHGFGMPRQSSNLTQASGGSGSTTNNANGVGTGGAGAAMKIKVYFQDDLIAIRVASDIRFEALRERLRERLHIPVEQSADMMIQYKDEPTNSYVELRSSTDLDVARDRNLKLTLFVNVPQ